MPFHSLIDPHRLIKLGHDLIALEQSTRSAEIQLEGAPLLESWVFIDARWKGLAGYAYGHPKLGDGHVFTTPVVAMDDDAGWAQTVNTLYRLGEPARAQLLTDSV